MTRTQQSASFRSGVHLALAVALGLAGVGQVAAAAEPEAPVVTTPAPGLAAESASQRGRERTARRFERRAPSRQRREFREGRRDGRRGMAGAWFGRRMASELNLTDEQREQLRLAMRENSDSRRDSRRQIADARRSFRQAVRDPEVTPAQLQALGEAVGRAQADAVVQRRADRERIAGILTDEQRQRLERMRERRGERFRAGPRGRRNSRRG